MLCQGSNTQPPCAPQASPLAITRTLRGVGSIMQGGAGVAEGWLGPRPGVVLTLPGQGENPFILALRNTTQTELELISFASKSVTSNDKSHQGQMGAATLTRRGPQVCRCPPCLNRSARPESNRLPSTRLSRRAQRLTRPPHPAHLTVSTQPSFTHHQVAT